jgi:GDP-4-dehydro-6-deoxy-D-mannose reductase
MLEEIILCDLTDREAVGPLKLPKGLDAVLNLAGFASNNGGDEALIRRVNVEVHRNLYTRIRQLGLTPLIIAVSSSTVYDQNSNMPQTEETTLKDPNQARPYEASKIEMEQIVRKDFADFAITIARPFNHVGVGQAPQGFIVPDFTHQILNALKTGQTVQTGSLHTRRDYSSVTDVVRAYADIVDSGIRGETLNICSGETLNGQQILDHIIDRLNVRGKVSYVIDPAKMRPGEIEEIVGSHEKLSSLTSWQPTPGGALRAIDHYVDSVTKT